jgi:cyclin A
VSSARGSALKSASIKPAPPISRHDSTAQKHYVPAPPKAPAVLDVPSRIPALVPCSTFMSPGRSGDSVSVDETMSTCDSMKSPDIEYIDNGDSSMLASLQRRANEHLRISDDRDVGGLF